MKKLFALVALLLLISLKGYAYEQELPQWKKDLFIKVASDYSKDYNVDKCYINGEELPLAGIIMGIASSESTFGTKGMGMKYNNRGNLKYASQYKLPKQNPKTTIHGDGGAYFVYSDPYNGLYDVANWIDTRGKLKCTVTYRTFQIYVKGTKKLSQAEINSVNAHVNNIIEVARAFRDGNKVYEVDNAETQYLADTMNGATTIAPTKIQNINAGDEKPKPKRICREITITIEKGEYLELSFMGRLRRTYKELRAGEKLKICRDI